MHEVLVKNEGETVRGAPHFLRSMPMSKKDYDGKLDHPDVEIDIYATLIGPYYINAVHKKLNSMISLLVMEQHALKNVNSC